MLLWTSFGAWFVLDAELLQPRQKSMLHLNCILHKLYVILYEKPQSQWLLLQLKYSIIHVITKDYVDNEII